MPYTPEQIAAFIGAAAWIPQLITWGHKLYRRPTVVLIPDSRIEIGYTNLGPIFNLRLAVSVDTQDVLLDNFVVHVEHESGEIRQFVWQGTRETFSQIRDPSGSLHAIEKDESGVAIKVRPDVLVDKFFRFQDPSFAALTKTQVEEVLAHHAYLLEKSENVFQGLMRSDKLHALLSTYKSNFCWRPGRYSAVFRCDSINAKILQNPTKFNFTLSAHDIEQLRGNFNVFEPYFEWHTFKGKEGQLKLEPVFQWIYPSMSR